jgi:hypothetical protein
MKYTEIKPGDRLKPYVKCYYILVGDIMNELRHDDFFDNIENVMEKECPSVITSSSLSG